MATSASPSKAVPPVDQRQVFLFRRFGRASSRNTMTGGSSSNACVACAAGSYAAALTIRDLRESGHVMPFDAENVCAHRHLAIKAQNAQRARLGAPKLGHIMAWCRASLECHARRRISPGYVPHPQETRCQRSLADGQHLPSQQLSNG